MSNPKRNKRSGAKPKTKPQEVLQCTVAELCQLHPESLSRAFQLKEGDDYYFGVERMPTLLTNGRRYIKAFKLRRNTPVVVTQLKITYETPILDVTLATFEAKAKEYLKEVASKENLTPEDVMIIDSYAAQLGFFG